jgi:hypothetical protein
VHHPTDRIIQQLRQDVDMIGHKAVSVKVEWTLGLLGFKKVEKLFLSLISEC